MIIQELTHSDVLNYLPERDIHAHKGNFGKLLLLCGSRGYTGAAQLAAMGALRCGSGLVYLVVPECIYEIEAVKLTEPIVYALPDDGVTYAVEALEPCRKLFKGKDAVLIGPGIGLSEGSSTLVRSVLTDFSGPVILDADGITAVSQHKDILRGRTSPTILTPHEGEFIRLGEEITADRAQSAAKLARDLGVIVVLKGHGTIITDGFRCFRNPTGNPGMATGGSGDVLAGIIASLVGQGLEPIVAAACGAWLHGAAGDICQEEIGQYGMLPTDMLHVLPRLLK